ncbi:phosphopantetheine-binding protein, partial [Burkholderia pseudomallei]|uniref:phosphopantetheine-binding protein n=1 Tax=Burkholderia pseudomallei TaxID=28450 RepID=UPI001177EE20
APRPAAERHVAARAQRRLNNPAPIGRVDRFFARGGDSLAAMQLQTAIRLDWRVNLRLDTLFDDAPLAELAARIDAAEREARQPAAIGTTARRAIAADAIDARATGQMGRAGAAGGGAQGA